MTATISMGRPSFGHLPGSVQDSTDQVPEKVDPAPAQTDFDSVYVGYVDFVWRALRHLGVPAAQLDDGVQELFVVVHRRLGEFEGRSSLRTWIYGIAVGIARNVRRSMRRQGHVESIEPWVDEMRASDRVDEEAEARDLVGEALERLDEHRREVLVLADVEELTAPEIAGALGIPLGTVYSRLRVARREFESAVRVLEAKGAGR